MLCHLVEIDFDITSGIKDNMIFRPKCLSKVSTFFIYIIKFIENIWDKEREGEIFVSNKEKI